MKVEVKTIPPRDGDEKVCERFQKIVEDRNKVISKRFGVEAKDVGLELYHTTGNLRKKINPNDDLMGVFGGYIDGSDSILLAHPDAVSSIFRDNLDKEMGILIDYALTKFYMCKVYYPEIRDFKLYYKYISEALASITAGNYKEDIIKFDIKTYFEGKRYKKDKELMMIFYIMLQNSGTDFIYSHLNDIVEECDIKKTVFKIYRKSFSELIGTLQKKILEEDKKLHQTFRPGRVR